MEEGLRLENRHTGERVEMLRATDDSDDLERKGYLPPGRAAMSVHVHLRQDVSLHVKAGRLHLLVDGGKTVLDSGDSLELVRGTAYRLWNEGREPVEYEAVVSPAGDLDQYLQAYFDVVNAGEPNRPSLAHLARVHMRHQDTQSVRLLSGPLQSFVFLAALAKGSLTGGFRGEDWPGSPNRSPGLPSTSDTTEDALTPA